MRKENEIEKSLSANLGIDHPFSAYVSPHIGHKKTFRNHFSASGNADKYMMSDCGKRWARVEWNLEESKKARVWDGLPSEFLAAGLLERIDRDAKFIGTFKLEFDTGFLCSFKRKTYDWRRLNIADDPINFEADAPPKVLPRGLDEYNLDRYRKEHGLEALTRIPGMGTFVQKPDGEGAVRSDDEECVK